MIIESLGAPHPLVLDDKALAEYLEIKRVSASVRVARAFYSQTQSDLAREIGVSRKTILALENGLAMPSAETFKKLQRYFVSRGIEIQACDSSMRFCFHCNSSPLIAPASIA